LVIVFSKSSNLGDARNDPTRIKPAASRLPAIMPLDRMPDVKPLGQPRP
jgi:hypothetical protein